MTCPRSQSWQVGEPGPKSSSTRPRHGLCLSPLGRPRAKAQSLTKSWHGLSSVTGPPCCDGPGRVRPSRSPSHLCYPGQLPLSCLARGHRTAVRASEDILMERAMSFCDFGLVPQETLAELELPQTEEDKNKDMQGLDGTSDSEHRGQDWGSLLSHFPTV